MAKKPKHNGNHGQGSAPGTPPFFRGRGRGGYGRGRGGSRGYAPARGGYHANSTAGPKSPGSSFLQEDLDFTVQMYTDASNPPQGQLVENNGYYSTPRGGRGGGRGKRGRGPGTSGRGFITPTNVGRGGSTRGGNQESPSRGQEYPDLSPRRGRGLGASPSPRSVKNMKPNSTLSELLYASRPLLRPVKFVRSIYTPLLFQGDWEEILRSVTEENGQATTSHVPTADRVERIFHGASNPFAEDESTSSSSSDDDNEAQKEIEEVDFKQMDRLFASPLGDQAQGPARTKQQVEVTQTHRMVENQVTTRLHQGPNVMDSRAQRGELHTNTLSNMKSEEIETEIEEDTRQISQELVDQLFFIDTAPAPPSSEPPLPPTPPDDEEIVVYVAPYPKVHSQPRSQIRQQDGISFTRPTPQLPTVNAFQPYNPPSTLSIASMSIGESPPTSDKPQIDQVPIPPVSTTVVPGPPTETPVTRTLTPPILIPTISSLKFNILSTLNQSIDSLSSFGRKLPGITTPRVAKKQKAWERKKAKRERQKAKAGRGSFAAYGALLSDARLYDDSDGLGNGLGRDQRWEERRRGDSDIDWGTGGSGDERKDVFVQDKSEKAKGKQKAAEVVEVETDQGMDVDSEMDIEAMKQFVSGLMGQNADRFITMDNVEDEKMIKAEDEEGLGGAEGSSDEDDSEDIDDVLDLEEKLLIGEGDDDDDDDDLDSEDIDSDDEELDATPRSGFQARLEKLRARARAKKPVDDDFDEDEEDDDEDMVDWNMALAEEDDYDDDLDLIVRIQDILDDNADILEGRDRKARNKLFSAVQNGDFADMQRAGKRKDKYKDIPPELADQWELDRQRKAERKRERELQKLIAASDPFTKKKGGKKGRKAMLKASRMDPDTINLGPNRIIDITTLVQQIRRFVENLNGPQSMSLPPANKETRKNVHELAVAFGLKSISKGKGNARYTTLIKTSKSGVGRVDEWKVENIVRRSGGRGARGDNFGQFDFGEGGRGGRGRVPKHREGDEVGASAPKISEGNVGFKMLAAMGWSEGGRIGLSGGLDAPLVAIIKHSKLGLGASK